MPAVSTNEPLGLTVYGVTEPILPNPLTVAERASRVFNCLHRIAHNFVVHALIFEGSYSAGRTVHIANPDLYTNKGKLTES